MLQKLETLTEIRKNQCGTGLLIEHDGHILGNKDTIQQIKEDIANHERFVIPDRFVVNAVFQKYGIKNANGRVYPENILKPAVEKYINERVSNRSAVGALDHPECQLPDTQILTKNGWVKIQDVKNGDEILTLNEDKKIEIHKIDKKIESQYKGKMIRLYNRSIDLTVTPNHKFPIFDRNYNFKGFYTAQEMADGLVPSQRHCYLLKAQEYNKSVKNEENGISLDELKFEEVEYDGMVYCVQVENHDFYTMDLKGHCVWSGNSTTLSGHDVTHVITNLQWQGRTLIGEMELHLSPGYKRYGICSTSGDLVANMLLDDILIGVSSRGVGTVSQRLGVLEVEDDFELISWDVVLENSTPGAKICMSKEELSQYIESDNSKEGKNSINEKLLKVKSILI